MADLFLNVPYGKKAAISSKEKIVKKCEYENGKLNRCNDLNNAYNGNYIYHTLSTVKLVSAYNNNEFITLSFCPFCGADIIKPSEDRELNGHHAKNIYTDGQKRETLDESGTHFHAKNNFRELTTEEKSELLIKEMSKIGISAKDFVDNFTKKPEPDDIIYFKGQDGEEGSYRYIHNNSTGLGKNQIYKNGKWIPTKPDLED